MTSTVRVAVRVIVADTGSDRATASKISYTKTFFAKNVLF